MKGLTEVALVKESVVGEQKEYFGLKLWQLGVLFGVPSALAVLYLFYSKKQSQEGTKDTAIVNTKKKTTLEQKTAEKKQRIEDLVKLFLSTVIQLNRHNLFIYSFTCIESTGEGG